jgi:hypothetical protein
VSCLIHIERAGNLGEIEVKFLAKQMSISKLWDIDGSVAKGLSDKDIGT